MSHIQFTKTDSDLRKQKKLLNHSHVIKSCRSIFLETNDTSNHVGTLKMTEKQTALKTSEQQKCKNLTPTIVSLPGR